MGESETSLLTRCRLGEGEAWETLFESYYAPACRFISQVDPIFTPEDVEEIAQETFVAVVRGLKEFKSSSQFLTWLYRIAMNKARDHRDKRLASKRGGGQITLSLDAPKPDSSTSRGDASPAITPPCPLPTPDQTLIRSEHMALIRQGLDQLGDPCRDILELRYFADLSYEEIGLALALNEKTVSSRLSRCLDTLGNTVRELAGLNTLNKAGQSGAVSV